MGRHEWSCRLGEACIRLARVHGELQDIANDDEFQNRDEDQYERLSEASSALFDAWCALRDVCQAFGAAIPPNPYDAVNAADNRG